MEPVPFGEAARVWLRIGLESFGGPAGQIAVMHRVVVEERKWVSEERFLHALNYCMLLPGPEAMQLATYLGWLLHGTKGGLTAGSLFVLPGFLAVLGLSAAYAVWHDVGAIGGALFGVKAAVLAVVVEAVIRIGRRVARGPLQLLVAAAAFVALFFFEVPFPLVVIVAGVAGWLGKIAPPPSAGTGTKGVIDHVLDAGRPPPTLGGAVQTAVVWLFIWWAPLLALAVALGPDHVLSRVGVFFSQVAVVTFGGAYAVLAYISQHVVEEQGWLTAGEMLDGLGLAETTPGPLILVTEFVGYQAAYRNAGPFSPAVAGVLGACVTGWATFAPCFLWIFVGAPYVEAVRGHQGLASALQAITAAVVGVVMNLAVWFALHVCFREVAEREGPLGMRLLLPSDPDPIATVIALIAMIAMLRFHVGMLKTLAAAAIAGAAWWAWNAFAAG